MSEQTPTRRPMLIVPVGVPGSGKSTWAKELLDVGCQIVSTDLIRLELAGSLQAANAPAEQARINERVFELFHRRIGVELDRHHDVIADATNLGAGAREELWQLSLECGAAMRVVLFDDLERALIQNRARADDAIVPDEVMERMLADYAEAAEQLLTGPESGRYEWVGAAADLGPRDLFITAADSEF